MKQWVRMLGALLLIGHLVAHSAVLDVVYPRIEERAPDDYGYQVLELALAKSGLPYRLRLSDLKMNQERARSEMERGTISVMDFGTGPEYEVRFRAVYFPIDRGLSGYRLCIINRALAPDFAKIRTLAELRTRVAGQGPGWTDSKILSANGIRVLTAQFEDLFRMVDGRRFDYYPLGVEEVYGFMERYRSVALHSMVEERLAIHYPFARLFFVRRDNEQLHDALLLGLKRAFSDGSFQRLLESNSIYRKGLELGRLKNRVIIELDNPGATPAFRAIPAEYFYSP